MFAQVFTLLVLSALAQASEQPKEVLCDICVDVVTDLDNWLVDDATEADIVAFVEQVSYINTPTNQIIINLFSSALLLVSFSRTWKQCARTSLNLSFLESLMDLLNKI